MSSKKQSFSAHFINITKKFNDYFKVEKTNKKALSRQSRNH